jgi:hypothetical protein
MQYAFVFPGSDGDGAVCGKSYGPSHEFVEYLLQTSLVSMYQSAWFNHVDQFRSGSFDARAESQDGIYQGFQFKGSG